MGGAFFDGNLNQGRISDNGELVILFCVVLGTNRISPVARINCGIQIT